MEFEPHDLEPKHVYATFALVALGALVVHVVLAWLYLHWARQAPGSFAAESPPLTALELWPKPALQTSPAADLAHWRAFEEAWLQSSGWVNHTQRVARIPIQQAMDLLIKEGRALHLNPGPAQSAKPQSPGSLQ